MIPLSLSPQGTVMTIKSVGGEPEIKRHLESLGFSSGSQVMVTSVLNGNVIVKIKESRIAISGEMARKIMV